MGTIHRVDGSDAVPTDDDGMNSDKNDSQACDVVGHEWIAIDDERRVCGRCGAVRDGQ